MLTTKLDKTTTLAATHSSLAESLSDCAPQACPDLKAIYLLILKAFFVTSVLGCLFIACPAALAEPNDGADAGARPLPHASRMLNLEWQPSSSTRHSFSWLRQNDVTYRSVDGLHNSVQQLRRVLAAWWAGNKDQPAISSQVKSLLTATGNGPYAAWSYNIGATSKALEIKIKYEF